MREPVIRTYEIELIVRDHSESEPYKTVLVAAGSSYAEARSKAIADLVAKVEAMIDGRI